jgi:transposase-like protein
MSRKRKNYAPEEKMAILKRRLLEKVPLSDLCDELGLNPTVLYSWHKLFSYSSRTGLPGPTKNAEAPRWGGPS